MKRFVFPLLLAGLVSLSTFSALFSVAAFASSNSGDNQVLAARDAYRSGNAAKLAKQLDAVRGHELAPYVEYWQLSMRLTDSDPALVRDFLAPNEGSYIAEKLRGEWLKTLGRRQQWDLFDSEYSKLPQPDQDTVCYALQSRLRLSDSSALEEARPLWFSLPDMSDACSPLMDRLVLEGRLDIDDVWERVRRLLEAKKPASAKQVLQYLPAKELPDSRAIDSIADRPQHYLDKLSANFASTRPGREMALYAVQRLARTDASEAALHWRKIQDKFSVPDRGYIYGQLGWQGAQRHMSEALGWYELAGDAPLSAEQAGWKVRSALRALDWKKVNDAIQKMPAALQAQPDWTYWRARADVVLGRMEEAKLLYRRIGGQPNFYSNLADEEMGLLIDVPAKASRATPEEIKEALENRGIRRALALFRLDMRTEAVREFNWNLRGMSDRQLLAAAELAQKNEIFDRAISAADRTQVEHNYALRFPAPHREHVQPKARELRIDESWIYGLVRQESRFVTHAKSTVGAKGLMQLMPKTAAWMAKKIGLKDFHPDVVSKVDVNVTLGTSYLKLVLAELDNHPVLASAAYNAGPGRARRWRDVRPMEGAIYAESIPFAETRDYVKKVMSNTVYYSALFEGKPQSLKRRLGTVNPRGAKDKPVTEGLP